MVRWKGERGRTWRAPDSVSEQKTWSDGSRQPMGYEHAAVEWEVSGGWGDGGCGGWSWCVRWWVGESSVGTGISTLSHRVSVQPSTTAEHTTLDSFAHMG